MEIEKDNFEDDNKLSGEDDEELAGETEEIVKPRKRTVLSRGARERAPRQDCAQRGKNPKKAARSRPRSGEEAGQESSEEESGAEEKKKIEAKNRQEAEKSSEEKRNGKSFKHRDLLEKKPGRVFRLFF